MAKPGSRAAAALAGRAADLSRAALSDDQVADQQERFELAQGLRCNGCGRRIGAGFNFTSIAPKEKMPVLKLSACSRDDCEYGLKCREGGTYMEFVEYVWLDELGLDAPPAAAVTKRLEKEAERAEARAAVEDRAAQSA